MSPHAIRLSPQPRLQAGMQHRDRIQQMLAEHVPGYDKKIHSETFRMGPEQAMVRARQLDLSAENRSEAGRNPTTGVYRLTESLREKDERPLSS